MASKRQKTNLLDKIEHMITQPFNSHLFSGVAQWSGLAHSGKKKKEKRLEEMEGRSDLDTELLAGRQSQKRSQGQRQLSSLTFLEDFTMDISKN